MTTNNTSPSLPYWGLWRSPRQRQTLTFVTLSQDKQGGIYIEKGAEGQGPTIPESPQNTANGIPKNLQAKGSITLETIVTQYCSGSTRLTFMKKSTEILSSRATEGDYCRKFGFS